jgi:hypothetical protein
MVWPFGSFVDVGHVIIVNPSEKSVTVKGADHRDYSSLDFKLSSSTDTGREISELLDDASKAAKPPISRGPTVSRCFIADLRYFQ